MGFLNPLDKFRMILKVVNKFKMWVLTRCLNPLNVWNIRGKRKIVFRAINGPVDL